MAYEWGPVLHESYAAAADLSASQFKVVTRHGAATVSLNGVAGTGFAILQNAPKAGQTADCATQGIFKALAGGTIAIDDYLTSDASGNVVKYTAVTDKSKLMIGRAREAAVVGQIFTGAFDFNGAVPVSDS
jgi:hypothetical protein